jgi:hypothetical protein
MKTKNSIARHFPSPPPTFGTKNRKKDKTFWENSVYYWWWEYLRRNQDYLKLCKQGSNRGTRNKIFEDFGDVTKGTFEQWWREGKRGERLFSESQINFVEVLKEGDLVKPIDSAVTISFPQHLPKDYLEKQFRKIIKSHHIGKRGKNHIKSSNAKYVPSGQPFMNALKKNLALFDYRISNPKAKLWEIGNAIDGYMLSQRIKPGQPKHETVEQRKVLAAGVSRDLRIVKKQINNVAKGIFP